MTRAVVIGGGLIGLSTAALLSRGGLEVTLLERHSNLGGLSAPIRAKHGIVDASPWSYSSEAVSRFLSLLGREPGDCLDLGTPDLRFRTFHERGVGVPPTVIDFEHDFSANWARLDEVTPDDGSAMSRLVPHAAERDDLIRNRLRNVPFDGRQCFVRSPLASHLPWLVRVLGGKIGKDFGSLAHTETRRLLECSILGLTGSPASTPLAYAYSYCHFLSGLVHHPRGGVGSLVSALEKVARDEGVDIMTECEAARILIDPDTTLATGIVTRSGGIVPAQLVVACVDPHHTETSLLAQEYRSFPESWWGDRQPSPSALVAVLTVKKRVPQLAHHNYFVPHNWKRVVSGLGAEPLEDPLAFEFVYVGRPTATDAKAAPRGKDLLTLVVPLPPDPSLGQTDDSRQAYEGLIARIVFQIGIMADIPDLGDRFSLDHVTTPWDFASDFSAWRGSLAGIAPTTKNLLAARPGNITPKVRNLLYPGTSILPGWGMDGALDSAEITVKVLLGHHGPGSLDGPLEPGFLRSTVRTDAIGDLLR